MENTSGLISNYNEASLKVLRIHRSQEVINLLRTNLLGKDALTNKYNYEIVISELISLVGEVKSKMSSTEKEMASQWREKIIDMVESSSIQKIILKVGLQGRGLYVKTDRKAWCELRKNIFAMEDFAKDMLDKHGFGSPNQINPNQAILN